ncbi:MAG: hypothetical protein GEU73_05100 [Chloroflexi bacterium]|nr:hypothetical protein [Chloroflexota bacterium]
MKVFDRSPRPPVTSLVGYETKVRMLEARVEAERQRAVEARRLADRERVAVERIREECDRKIARVIQTANVALDEAKRRIAMIGKGS